MDTCFYSEGRPAVLMSGKESAEQLWRSYLFLTREMVKFLEKKNLDMFTTLIEQREQTQKQIDANGGREAAFDGRDALIAEIMYTNQLIQLHLRRLQNQLRQNHNRSYAYEGVTPDSFRGYRADWQT